MNISIGLDKYSILIYSYIMTQLKAAFDRIKLVHRNEKGREKDFINFVGNQFKQLNRRNLGLPMKLYHL